MSTRVIILRRIDNISVNNTCSSGNIAHFESDGILFLKGKQNLTLVVILYEIYKTRRRLVLEMSYEMTTRIRSSICKQTV